MNRNFARVVSLFLVCSFVFSVCLPLSAGNCGLNNQINAVYSDLTTAADIVANGQIYIEIQNARPYLSHAQRLLKKHRISRFFDHKLDRVIDKAKTNILWNDRSDALGYINSAIRMVRAGAGSVCSGQSNGKNTVVNSVNGSGAGAGALIAAPIAIGIGAVLVNIFRNFGWGGFGTRIRMPGIPGSVVTVR